MFGWFRRKKTNREILINAESLETRVAVIENGKLEEFQIEHPTEERMVGSIFKGRIQNLENDLQAAFVDIGMKKNAFLHYWDMTPDESLFLDEDDEESNNNNNNRRRRQKKPRNKRYSNEEVRKMFPPGSEIVVQVTKGPIGTKGPRVTASLSIPGRYFVMMPGSRLKGVSRKIEDGGERQKLKKILDRLPVPENVGLIVRTAALEAGARSFARDLRGLLSIWSDLQKGIAEKQAPSCVYQEPALVERVVRDWLTEDVDRITVDDRDEYERIREVAAKVSRTARAKIHLYEGPLPVFDHYDVERQIEEAFRRRVTLKSGAYIVFDETEALIAIDVNTGRYKGRGSQEDAILEVNTEAVEEVARQLRLRNVGGLVIIDLIDMKSRKHQNAVYRRLKECFKRDKARTNVLPISELGILEMTRQRVEESPLSALHIDCPYCHGRGSVKSPMEMSVEIQRQVSAAMRKCKGKEPPPEFHVVVHPTVLERLRNEDEEFLMDLESRFEGRLSFRSDPSRHVEFFSVTNATNGEVYFTSVDK